MWNPSGSDAPDYLISELYGPDSQQEEEVEEMSGDDEFDELPGVAELSPPTRRSFADSSPVCPPTHRESRRSLSPLLLADSAPRRSRSRSPVRPARSPSPLPLGHILAMYDEEGRLLNFDDEVQDVDSELDRELSAPDASESVPSVRSLSVRSRARSVRGRGRGVRGRGRGRNLSRGRGGGRGTPQWEVGHPLHEIWRTDADVPPEMLRKAMETTRMREERARDVASARGERNRRERDRPEREEGSESEEEDEFADANDGRDLLEGQNLRFVWASMESFQGKEEDFSQTRTGSVRSHSSAYDAFRSYWTEDILDLIVAETNRYAATIVSVAFHNVWYPTNSHEILCLFAFWMMLGIVRMPTLHSCFSVNPLLKTEAFRRIFTRQRYENLTRALRFIEIPVAANQNPSNTGAANSSDRLHHLRPILNHLNLKFQENYILQQDICIDESLTLWKGKLDIKQYIRSKASKFGVKTFELCESATGYLWSFIVYTGKKDSPDLVHDPTTLKSTAVVKRLMGPLLNKGHRLFMDNWYNSPHLARFLKLNGTDCVGTLRPSRTDVPALINMAPLKRGELVARHSGDVSVLAWQDKRRITMISTCHGSSTALPRVPSNTSTRPGPFKPQVVLDYNKFMGGVDLKDQMLEPYLLERKRCTQWYMKLFKRLLNVSILNSRILLESSTQRNHDHLSFRLHLVDSVLTHHLSLCPSGRHLEVSTSRSSTLQTGRFCTNKHWPVHLEQTDLGEGKFRTERRRCIACLKAKRDRKTTFKCEACNVPLCVDECFKTYHLSSYSDE